MVAAERIFEGRVSGREGVGVELKVYNIWWAFVWELDNFLTMYLLRCGRKDKAQT